MAHIGDMKKRHFLRTMSGASIGLLLSDTLWARYAIDAANVHGVRVTPSVYASTAERDVFVNALTRITS